MKIFAAILTFLALGQAAIAKSSESSDVTAPKSDLHVLTNLPGFDHALAQTPAPAYHEPIQLTKSQVAALQLTKRWYAPAYCFRICWHYPGFQGCCRDHLDNPQIPITPQNEHYLNHRHKGVKPGARRKSKGYIQMWEEGDYMFRGGNHFPRVLHSGKSKGF